MPNRPIIDIDVNAEAKEDMETGTLKSWIGDRGFGFIRPVGDGDDVFVHVTAFTDGEVPALGQRVTFQIVTDPRSGKPRAADVRPA